MKRSPMELKTGTDLRHKRIMATTSGVPMSKSISGTSAVRPSFHVHKRNFTIDDGRRQLQALVRRRCDESYRLSAPAMRSGSSP